VLASLLITLREGFEAALVVAVILGALRRLGALERARAVWAGVALAGGVSALAAAALFFTGRKLDGSAEALFEGIVMLTAVAMMSWMILWLQRQARGEGARLNSQVDSALAAGSAALFGVAFVAVLREGLETALFLLAAAGGNAALGTTIGVLAGLALAAGLGVVVYRSSARLPLRTFFTVTNVLLVLFGAYLLWRGLREVGEVTGVGAVDVLAPLAGVTYAALALVALRRSGRRGVAGAARAEVELTEAERPSTPSAAA
jgi:high-affinity iron transporter